MAETNLVVSPCSNPELDLDGVFEAYTAMGYRKFEVFTAWAGSAFDVAGDPSDYVAKARQYGMRLTSLHLPAVEDDVEASLARTIAAARFARAVGAEIVLLKATRREHFLAAGRAFLDAVEPLGLTPVVQNHAGTAITTLDDMRAVLDGIGDDRLGALLEVGHFHTVGVGWREAAEALGERIALVHVKDQLGPQSVPFGTGEIDLPGLFAHLAEAGYDGDFVVEMEVADKDNTLRYLAEARDYLAANCEGVRL